MVRALLQRYSSLYLLFCLSFFLLIPIPCALAKSPFSSPLFMSVFNVWIEQQKSVEIEVPNDTPFVARMRDLKSPVFFSISINRLTERNSEGQQETSVEFDSVDFTVYDISSSPNQAWISNATLPNDAIATITVSFFFSFSFLLPFVLSPISSPPLSQSFLFFKNLFWFMQFLHFKTASNYTYLGQTQTFPAETLKFNFRIENWPFKGIHNSLDVEIDSESSSPSNDNCQTGPSSQTDPSGNLAWIKLNLNGFSLYHILFLLSIVTISKYLLFDEWKLCTVCSSRWDWWKK